ncbi:uncharacterized protein [Lolium perenne]|uniref:uncharacterized protein isoform X2 n=1 Tax=Lolium perenne TaxID=4522 RepID=UPI003A99808F
MPHTSRPHSRISSSLMNLDVRAALVWEAAWPRQKDQTESSVEGSKKEGTIFRVDYCCSGLITTSTKLCSLLSSRSGAVHAQDGLDGAAATGHNYLSTEGTKVHGLMKRAFFYVRLGTDISSSLLSALLN